MTAYLRASLEDVAKIRLYAESVHRLTDSGAVVTHVTEGSSLEGLDVEWRIIGMFTVAGDVINRLELFEEGQLDAALARLDELSPPASRLSNEASRAVDHFFTQFTLQQWDSLAELIAADYCSEDRRRVVNAGLRRGRDAEIDNFRAVAEVGMSTLTSSVIATRGKYLALSRFGSSEASDPDGSFGIELLGVAEVNPDGRIAAAVVFDPDDFTAALEELDARYLADRSTAEACVWSVISQAYAALNRQELPTLATDFVDVDHRPVTAIGSGDLMAYLRAALDDLSDNRLYVEAVHRIGSKGAVVSHVATGTSHEGSYAEWRMLAVYTVSEDRMNRCELFDEGDIDTALARFEELTNSPNVGDMDRSP